MSKHTIEEAKELLTFEWPWKSWAKKMILEAYDNGELDGEFATWVDENREDLE